MSGRLKKATREKARLRLAIYGPPKAGKSYTSLRLAFALADLRGREHGRPGRVAAIDTERGSLSKYVGECPDGIPFDFLVIDLDKFPPSDYTSAIKEIEAAGVDVIVIDSLSHAWEGVGGALDQVERKKGTGNDYAAWKDVTPQHRRMVDTILASPLDVICTMRVKVETVMEPNAAGKMAPRKIGTKPVQREGMEYEFDIIADIDTSHVLTVGGTRCRPLDGLVVVEPDATFIKPVYDWLVTGTDAAARSTGGVAGGIVTGVEDHAVRAAAIEAVLRDADRIGWDRKKVDAEAMAGYGAKSLDHLASGELAAFSRRLASLPTKKKATTTTPATPATPTPAVTPTPTPAPTPAPASLPPSDPDLVEDMSIPPKKITPGQVAEITSLKAELFSTMPQGQADRNAFWKLQLAHYGVATARDMSEETAALFILRLRHEIDMRREGGDPFTNPVEVTPTPTPTATPTPDTETAA